MPRLTHDPKLAAAKPDAPFLQTLRLLDGATPLGHAVWHAPATGDLAQILEIDIAPPLQRQGHGSRLLLAAFQQMARLGVRRGRPIRLAWCLAEQKNQIHFRGFLFKHGFHHVCSPKRLLVGQDAMLYVKSFD